MAFKENQQSSPLVCDTFSMNKSNGNQQSDVFLYHTEEIKNNIGLSRNN